MHPPSLNPRYAHNQALATRIQARIAQAGGWLSFAEFMRYALYSKPDGYYQTLKLGADFTTAPEISPFFGKSLARQIQEVLQNTGGEIVELGAGSGSLALTLLQQLAIDDSLPTRYCIVEPSTGLRQQQRQHLHHHLPAPLFALCHWYAHPPQSLCGVVLGNEVLDALPVHIVERTQDGFCEHGVTWRNGEWAWQTRPLNRHCRWTKNLNHLPTAYISEVCPAAEQLVRRLAQRLQQGVLLWIDYGFTAQQYYHPQRNRGTLMCHFQHLSHTNPLINIGLQDISAHVNFSAIANIAHQQGLDIAGFCSQAQFLLNCGILQWLAKSSPEDALHYLPQTNAVKKLLSPSEMGELFQVLALSRNLPLPLLGFREGDKTHRL